MYKIIFSNGFIINSAFTGLAMAKEEAYFWYTCTFHNDGKIVRIIIGDGTVIWEDPDFDFKLLEGLI